MGGGDVQKNISRFASSYLLESDSKIRRRKMSTKRILTIVLVASAVLLAVGIGPRFSGTARALPPAQTGVTVPYSGSLTEETGQPVADGAYDFTFALYAAESGGEPAWTEAQKGVTVQGGAFTALLGSVAPLPKEALDGGARWLEVTVRGPGETEFTPLSPRQELSAAAPASPADLAAPAVTCPHDHLYANWVGSSAGYTFRIVNNSTGDGIRGISYATAADFAGVVGANYASGTGVYGQADSGHGVYGVSTSGDGVVGETSVAVKSGVYGHNTGAGYGVFGRSTSGYGGGFTGVDDNYDLFLGGAVGRINANEQANSELYLSSNGDVIVKLDNDSGGNNVFHVWSSTGADLCTISEVGGLVCAAGKSAVVKTADYGWRRLYTTESPEVWFEDLGTASLVDGKATVTFEPIFAETVNLEEDYHVFVTPLCQEPVLLFVIAKTSTGFTVQGVTLDNQPSSCDFDYRVAAKRLGYENVRLEETDWQEGE
jgi:hypothetical protein